MPIQRRQRRIPATTTEDRSALQSQNAVTAYLKSKQLLPFGFAELRSPEADPNGEAMSTNKAT